MLITGIPPHATQIAFASSHRGLALGCAPEQGCSGRSITYRTSDGGLTWRRILSSGEPRIFSVESVPNVVAWLSAGRGRTAAIHLHEQVGRARTTVIAVRPRLATIAFRTKAVAWGATDARAHGGRFLVTDDGGRTWTGAPVNPCRRKAPATVRPVGVRSGFVVCVGTRRAGSQAQAVYRTTDDGRHWRLQTRQAGAGYAIRLTRSPDGRLWLTHARGPITVSSDLGRHWTARPDLSQDDDRSVPSISFAGRKAGFIDRVCGGRADLLRSADRGATWQAAPRAGTACAS
jgi:photosystem II stability/assembly factor-like uncharacterized protein